MQKPKVVAIVGPTASGKTSLSIEIAKRCNGEVISADSRQVYKGLDIGSGKVTEKEMQDVPHHVLDVVEPSVVYTAADFKHDATAALEDILKRGRRPIIAGGSFFYIELLRNRIQPAPIKPNPKLRKELKHLTNEELLQKISTKDPDRATTIDPDNRHRLIRSVEIIEELGVVPKPTQIDSVYDWLILGIDISKEQLHANIKSRLTERINEGMITEVERLHSDGLSWERLFELGLEYRYVAEYLQGNLSREEMIEMLETKIRQFAKRQLTWLKRDNEIEWYAPQNREAILRRVDTFLKG